VAPDGGPLDPRLRCLPAAMFFGREVLFVGSGAGYMALAIAELFRPARLLGLERDPGKVKKARFMLRARATAVLLAERAVRASLAAEGAEAAVPPDPARSATTGVKAANGAAGALEAAPASVRLQRAGAVPVHSLVAAIEARAEAAADAGERATLLAAAAVADDGATAMPSFPRNVTFRQEAVEASRAVATHGVATFDVVVCLGALRRCHVAGGDEGLDAMLGALSGVLRSGGVLVLEPKTWQHYRKAAKQSPGAAAAVAAIQLRPARLAELLVARHGFARVRWVGAPPLPPAALGTAPPAAPGASSPLLGEQPKAQASKTRRLLLAFKA